ncbi:MAG: substrate-binding domain-containing protein [Chloroflexota bacterium]
MKHSRLVAGLGAALLVASMVGTASAQSPAAKPDGGWKLGFSNPGGVGNGWREEQLCAAKAQALASGEVASIQAIHRNTDAAGQLEDIRTLISAGVNAIVVNPADLEALNPALQEAADKGIVVVAVDSPVSLPAAYNLSNDQENYAYLGAKWLFEQLGGKGNVVYMRGIPGVPADTDRDTGFKKALAEYPGITVVKETSTNWDPTTGQQQITDIVNSGTAFDGIWTSGIDSWIVDALKTAGAPLVPIVGADNSGFVNQLINEPGLVGAAVTNPGSVGGAGVALALKILDGQAPAEHTVKLTPSIWDNTTDAGKAALTAAADPALDPGWPVGISIPDWTTYTKDQLLACKGPGES